MAKKPNNEGSHGQGGKGHGGGGAKVDENEETVFFPAAKRNDDIFDSVNYLLKKQGNDEINHPTHYTDGPPCEHCGKTIEAIVVTETLGFNLGNAVKYIWRNGKKTPDRTKDLQKAKWYIERELKNLTKKSIYIDEKSPGSMRNLAKEIKDRLSDYSDKTNLKTREKTLCFGGVVVYSGSNKSYSCQIDNLKPNTEYKIVLKDGVLLVEEVK